MGRRSCWAPARWRHGDGGHLARRAAHRRDSSLRRWRLGLALLSLAGWLLLRGLGRCCGALRRALPSTLRHGIANLYRPGNQAQAAVVALGVGVMFTLTVYLVHGAGGHRSAAVRLRGCRTCFCWTFPAQAAAGVHQLIQAQAGVKEAPDVAYAVAGAASPRSTARRSRSCRWNSGRRFLRTRR